MTPKESPFSFFAKLMSPRFYSAFSRENADSQRESSGQDNKGENTGNSFLPFSSRPVHRQLPLTVFWRAANKQNGAVFEDQVVVSLRKKCGA